MTVDRDLERAVRAWVSHGPDEFPDPYLEATLHQVAATPQVGARWWHRTLAMVPPSMSTAAVAAVMFAAAILVFSLLPPDTAGPSAPIPTPIPTVTVRPTPALSGPTLAAGRFQAVFGEVQILATGAVPDVPGSGTNVSGSMEISASAEESFSVDLLCARSEPDGILLLGGPVTESGHPDVPEGSRVAIALQVGDPPQAILWFEGDTLARSCTAFLRRAPEVLDFLEPIDGVLELGR